MKKLGITVIAATALLLASCSSQPAIFTDAVDTCDLTDNPAVTVEDAGSTLVFDMQGDEETTGASIDELACLLVALDAPTRVTTHMSQTTSIDGRQADEWEGVEVSWSYHPSRGLDALFVVVD